MDALEEAAKKFGSATNDDSLNDAFRVLADEIQRTVEPVVSRQCSNDDDVQSVTQETLIKVAGAVRDLRDLKKIRTWVIQIAKRTAWDFNRTRKRKIKQAFSIEEFEDALERGLKVQNPPLTPDEVAQ